MESLYNIEGAKLTALEIHILTHIAGSCEGVWKPPAEDISGIRSQIDQLVLAGFLERDCDHTGWLDVWRIPDGCWADLSPHVHTINSIIDNIGEA